MGKQLASIPPRFGRRVIVTKHDTTPDSVSIFEIRNRGACIKGIPVVRIRLFDIHDLADSVAGLNFNSEC